MVEKLVEVHGINPATADMDLASAQLVNKRNLESIEELFSDSIYRMMVELKARVMNTGLKGVKELLQQKLEMDEAKRRETFTKSLSLQSILNPFIPLYSNSNAILGSKDAHPDLYVEDSSNIGQDTKFGANETILAKICIQSLAFEHRADFMDLCRGTVLKSYYSKAGVKGLDMHYSGFLNLKNSDSIRKSRDLTSKNICAFNQFSIKNLVHMLKDQDKQMYNEIAEENY